MTAWANLSARAGARMAQMGVSENRGYLILGVLLIRILLFRVLHEGSLFRETPSLASGIHYQH